VSRDFARNDGVVVKWPEGVMNEDTRSPEQRARDAESIAALARVPFVAPSPYVDGCQTCERVKANGGFGPRHVASKRCESGGYPHCSCDTCF
jgi:hypothetical protein